MITAKISEKAQKELGELWSKLGEIDEQVCKDIPSIFEPGCGIRVSFSVR